MAMILNLYSTQIVAATKRVWDHSFGYFSETLDDISSLFLSRLLINFQSGTKRVFLRLSVFEEEEWREAAPDDWITIRRAPYPRSFFRVPWVFGYSESEDAFRRVLQFGWNFAYNEPMLALYGAASEDGSFLEAREERRQVFPGNEDLLLEHYDALVSRACDGLWLRALSPGLDPTELTRQITIAAQSVDLDVIVTPTESSVWKPRNG